MTRMIVDQDQLYEAANQISDAVFPEASALIVAALVILVLRLAGSMDIPVIELQLRAEKSG